jgi:tetratricopeptide (TPR) repeat protein
LGHVIAPTTRSLAHRQRGSSLASFDAMRRALTCILLASLACSCNGKPSQATDESSTQQLEVEGASADLESPQPPANTFVAPDTTELTSLATALTEQLAAAREATNAEARSAPLERAVRLAPFDAALLAELARAYTDAGRLTDAVLLFDLALRHADDVPLRADMLVELGTAIEATGDRSRAAELYQRSVALHPTERAATQLAALTGVEVISHDTCAWTRHGPPAIELCPAYVQSRGASPDTCAYAHPMLELDADTKVAIFSHLDPSTAIEVYVVNAIIGGVWYSSPLTWVSHPEVAHADESVARLDMRLEQLAPDRKPQVVLEWELERRAVDPAKKTIVSHRSIHLAVLSVSALDPRWWLGLRTASTRSEQLASDPSEATTTQSSVGVTWIRETGELELLRTEHAPSTALGKFALGTYPILCPSEIDGS